MPNTETTARPWARAPYSRVLDGAVCWFRDDGVCITGPADTSRDVSHIWWAPGGHDDYNEDCAACWLGHGHSLDYHNRAIGNRGALSRIHDEQRQIARIA